MSGEQEVPTGQDTATGTDPDAKYDEPGYQDKSLGQAVDQDMDTVDALVAESDGDLDEAETKFDEESAGAPALARQRGERTGEAQAQDNRDNDPPV